MTQHWPPVNVHPVASVSRHASRSPLSLPLQIPTPPSPSFSSSLFRPIASVLSSCICHFNSSKASYCLMVVNCTFCNLSQSFFQVLLTLVVCHRHTELDRNVCLPPVPSVPCPTTPSTCICVKVCGVIL